jgi:hypothetical protein
MINAGIWVAVGLAAWALLTTTQNTRAIRRLAGRVATLQQDVEALKGSLESGGDA